MTELAAQRRANFETGGRKGKRSMRLITVGAVVLLLIGLVVSIVSLSQSPGFGVSAGLEAAHAGTVDRAFYVAGMGERLVVVVRGDVSARQAGRFACEVVRPALEAAGLRVPFIVRDPGGNVLASQFTRCSVPAPAA